MSISQERKTIARAAHAAFGGKPSVVKYWDNKKESSIDILSSADSPVQGVASYSTVGLSENSIGMRSENDIPIRVELVGACAIQVDRFANILATSAFNVINSQFACYPGAIYKNVVGLYVPNTEMKHVLFVNPFLWEPGLETLHLPDKHVSWLLCVPISENELAYAERVGTEELEYVFETEQIDIFDIYRKSAIR